LGGAEPESFKAFTRYGERIGLAFQIADDVLDVEGHPDRLGKNVGGDQEKKKATYPALMGIEESKKRAREFMELAIESLNPFGEEANSLRAIARFIVARDY